MEKIIQDILKRLKYIFSSDNKDWVGVESIIQKIESSFWMGINDVYPIGIWGIGGIGKTTIASIIYNKISSQFESSYFTQNVREESENANGLTHLREKLLSTILEDKNLCLGTPNTGNMFIENRLRNKKVFIVFDDVTSSEQIEVLIGDLERLGFGNRIIITTRNRRVLINCGVDLIHHVVGLYDNQALQLFSRCTFKQDDPLLDYTELSNRAVRCAKGVPLALRVLGRFLQNRRKQDWESALDKLEESPHTDIQKVLKISYDGLDDEEKDLFLDIACFFKGWDENLVKEILDSCGLHVQIGISVLIDKTLITVSSNIITMHDLLQVMGREIVKQEFIYDPGERSRLWHHNDIYRVLMNNMGTQKIRGLCFDMFTIRHICLTSRAFSNIHNLRFLIINNANKENNNKVHGFHRLESNFRELRYLSWHEHPERMLPSQFYPECLVVLKMRHSNLQQLWTGVVNLANLEFIDLSYSSYLLKIPDLSYATNLQSLILEDCTNLFEITHLSIQNINSLVNLNLRNCKSLISLPIGIQSKALRIAILSGCSNLKTAPKISCNIEQLCLDGTAIEEFSSSIEYPPKLVELNLENCSKLKCLPNNFSELKSLRHLVLRGCLNLKSISKLPCEIEELDLDGTAIKELPSSIEYLSSLVTLKVTNCSRLQSLPNSFYKLKSLKYLDISGCSKLEKLPEGFGKLESLEVLEGNGLAITELPPSFGCLQFLKELSLNDCNIRELPDNLGWLYSLQRLFLARNKFQSIPTSIINLSNLYWFDVSYCRRLQSMRKFPSTTKFIDGQGCTSLREFLGLQIPSDSNRNSRLNLINCSSLDLNSDTTQSIFNIGDLASLVQRCKYTRGSMCCPGSEIPKWFAFQSTGSFIQLPRGSFERYFVGFVFGTVIAFQGYHHDSSGFNIECVLRVPVGSMKSRYRKIAIGRVRPLDQEEGTSYIKSEHLFIGFDFSMYSHHFRNLSSDTAAIVEFKILSSTREIPSRYCMVKKCGVSLLFSKEFEETMSNKIIEENENFTYLSW